MSGCTHEWRQVLEESLIEGAFPIGFECKKCGNFVAQMHMPVGMDTGEKVLIGPHGGPSVTASGTPYSKQILHKDGSLEIIP